MKKVILESRTFAENGFDLVVVNICKRDCVGDRDAALVLLANH
jgi:hypothetical protein